MALLDRIAVISDVHANVPALEAVLADIRGRGIDLIYNLGDLVGKGPQSDVAVDICRDACNVIVRGNWDDLIASPRNDLWPMTIWAQMQLGAARLAYLGSLPYAHTFWLSGRRVRLFHASADDIYRRIYPHDTPDIHDSMFQHSVHTGDDGPMPDIVGYGDIHIAYTLNLRHSNRLLFNPGSVGHPMDMPLASYAILSGKLDSQTPGPFSVELARVPYNIDAVVALARARAMPECDTYARELRDAIYYGRATS
jgi:protein phosphatase